MSYSESIKVLDEIVNILDKIDILCIPYGVLNDNNIYVRCIYKKEDDTLIYRECEHAITKIPEGIYDSEKTCNISIKQLLTSDTDKPITKDEGIKRWKEIGPKVSYIVKLVVGDKALFSNDDNENIKFCLKLTKGMNHYSKIGYIFSVLESMHEKGKGMNEKELKNDSEALEILKTFAR